MILACAMAVDGAMHDSEREEFNALLTRTKTLGPLRARHDIWWSQCVALMKKDEQFDFGRIADLAERAAMRLPKDMRLSAFAHACDIVLADSKVAMEEQWLIQMLIDTFELPHDQVRDVMRVLSWKNAF
ncbi:MAG: TerB family tellurite resistance protein [Hyphomonadaceae bacterium]